MEQVRVPDPTEAPPVRWGIVGAGFIAGKFVDAVTEHTRSTVTAVGSRDGRKAERFAAEHAVPAWREGYRALVEDPEVEAVYVATPHSHHAEHALLALAAGKPVLVEKPLAVTPDEGRRIAEAARAAGVFAMEAMWTRFLPHMVVLRDIVARGELGEPIAVHAEHGQRFAFDPQHRIYAPHLGGGALLDLGVYPVSFVHDVLGEPARVVALGSLTETGVDGHAALALGYPGRIAATVGTTLWALSAIDATVTGTDGRVEFDGAFLRPATLRVHRTDGTSWEYDGTVRNGFQYEVAEAARCIREGRLESDVLPLEASVAVLRTLDEALRQLGVRHPGAARD